MEVDMGLFNLLFGSGNASSSVPEQTVNVDGSPMVGGVDINGNPNGVTENTEFESSSCDFDYTSSKPCSFYSFDSDTNGLDD
tara:strand:- start:851 stop:1096 length:246 start_codon:yes stop_codon:yes gene_type:complete